MLNFIPRLPKFLFHLLLMVFNSSTDDCISVLSIDVCTLFRRFIVEPRHLLDILIRYFLWVFVFSVGELIEMRALHLWAFRLELSSFHFFKDNFFFWHLCVKLCSFVLIPGNSLGHFVLYLCGHCGFRLASVAC
jgi:hypothetical protein